jgi:hypothetical protein
VLSRHPIDAVQQTLAAVRVGGTFATRLTLPAADLALTVKGVGPLAWPISATMAKQLVAEARPAPYGLGERTLVDPRVRRSGEIAGGRAQIGARPWNERLRGALAQIRDALGLPETGRLVAKLDKMLVYAPGDFFAPHRDSEKVDGMVASLVVVLPSRSTGGALVVRHGGETVELSASPKLGELSLFAFYADCEHEVRPLESGHRVVLTYTLAFEEEGRAPAPLLEDDLLDQLTEDLDTYFETGSPPRYGATAPELPERFVYLFDHAYTERGLSWSKLKNGDRARALALREVATRLDYEIYLAQAEVHEQWSCEDDYDRRYDRSGRYRRFSRDEEDEADGGEELELGELFLNEISLHHWVDARGHAVPSMVDRVHDDEVCETRPSSELTPTRSEHEGYMGNYGNTVDRWYQRAAVVLWPRSRAFYLRAKLDGAWAIEELSKRLAQGARDEVLTQVDELLPVWPRSLWSIKPRGSLVGKLLVFASALDDGERASKLLAAFGLADLAPPRAAAAFGRLVGRWGHPWAIQLFEIWAKERRGASGDALPLETVCAALLAEGGEAGKRAAEALVVREVAAFLTAPTALWPRGLGPWPRGHAPDGLPERALSILAAAAVTSSSREAAKVCAALVSRDLSLPTLMKLVKLAAAGDGTTSARAACSALGLDPLVDRVEQRVDDWLSRPVRSSTDSSILWPAACKCDLCGTLDGFMRDPDRLSLSWPLNEQGRDHVEASIRNRALPVSHRTVRQGSPYQLVLEKLPELHQREAAWRTELGAFRRLLRGERVAKAGGGAASGPLAKRGRSDGGRDRRAR